MQTKFWMAILAAGVLSAWSAPAAAVDVDAQALEYVRGLIAAAPGGGDAFRETTGGALIFHDPLPGALHIQSGMICLAGRGDAVLVALAAAEHSRNAQCAYRIGGGPMAVFAMPLDGLTIAQFEAKNIAAFESDHPDAKRIDDPGYETLAGLDAPFRRAYRQSGPDRITSIWIGAQNGWAISVYDTSPAATHNSAEGFAIVAWAVAASSVRDAAISPLAAPTQPR